jgi:PKD repeat protein
MTRRITVVAVVAGVALAGSLSCTTRTDAPGLAGPSELATSITIYASPDVLSQDGEARSQVTIQVRDPRNQPVVNLPIRLDTSGNGVAVDVGQLSANQVVTGTDGRATASYTAPNVPRVAADALSLVTIYATPIGTNAAGATPRSVTIRLTSPTVVVPPSNPPKAAFTFSPRDPAGAQWVYFNASDSTGANPITTYAWDFGDGTGIASGVTLSHQFAGCSTSLTNTIPQTFLVRLTVTDSTGQSASAVPQEVTIANCK